MPMLEFHIIYNDALQHRPTHQLTLHKSAKFTSRPWYCSRIDIFKFDVIAGVLGSIFVAEEKGGVSSIDVLSGMSCFILSDTLNWNTPCCSFGTNSSEVTLPQLNFVPILRNDLSTMLSFSRQTDLPPCTTHSTQFSRPSSNGGRRHDPE